jgi:hypothetical protein
MGLAEQPRATVSMPQMAVSILVRRERLLVFFPFR